MTKLAYNQIRDFGMNDRLGHVSFPEGEDTQYGAKPYSQKVASLIDEVSAKVIQGHPPPCSINSKQKISHTRV